MADRRKKRTFEDQTIVQLVATLAIVYALMFVGFKVEELVAETADNTTAVRTDAYQELVSQLGIINTIMIENPAFAELWARILDGAEPRTYAERTQIISYMTMIYRHGEMAFRQYKSGIIDQPTLQSMLGPLREFIPTSLGQEMWSSVQMDLNTDYVRYVNELVGYNPVSSAG